MYYPRTSHPRRALSHALALLAFLAIASSGWSKVVYVNKNTPGTVHDGASWSTAFASVQPAIAAALTGDEIWVGAGTYVESITLADGVPLYGGFVGTESARGQRDWNAASTVLVGNGIDTEDSSGVYVQVQGAVLDGFTVRNSHVGIDVVRGSVSVANCTISGNQYGVQNYFGLASVTNCIVSGNIYTGVDVYGIASATITNSTISGSNFGVGTSGSESLANCTNSCISNNRRGVDVESGTATVLNSIISATSGDGVYIFEGTANITNSVISGSTGRALYFDPASFPISPPTANVTNCIIAFNGGGLSGDSPGHSNVVSVSHSDVYANPDAEHAGVSPDGNISSDPMFVNRTAGNFHLLGNSPCIDAGDDTAVTSGETDLDGTPRIAGLHVDMGAYELGAMSYTLADAVKALKIAGGLVGVPATDMPHLNAELASAGVDVADAIRIARKAAGLDTNP